MRKLLTLRIALAAIVFALLATVYGAHAFGIGKLGIIFGKEGASSKSGTVTPQPTGFLLMVDGVSFVLRADGVSKICLAGGCGGGGGGGGGAYTGPIDINGTAKVFWGFTCGATAYTDGGDGERV